jgi:hypothetical protein
MNRKAYDSGRIKQASQDDSREFISILACICALGSSIAPMIVYKGESMTLQDTWVDKVTENDRCFFASSSTGWSNKNLGINWLRDVFDRETRGKAGNRRRLLIVDGHS